MLQQNLDLARYQGLWYDMARIPKFFDKNNAWQTAEYTLMKDSDGEPYLKVHNIAYYENGDIKKEITGTARIVDPDQPAALNVSFGNFFSLFVNSDYANYLIHKTDYDNYAIVGSYDRDSLYILVRKRPISLEFSYELLDYVDELGYDVGKLKMDYGAVELGDVKDDTVNIGQESVCTIF